LAIYRTVFISLGRFMGACTYWNSIVVDEITRFGIEGREFVRVQRIGNCHSLAVCLRRDHTDGCRSSNRIREVLIAIWWLSGPIPVWDSKSSCCLLIASSGGIGEAGGDVLDDAVKNLLRCCQPELQLLKSAYLK
jgi:hypothetical protein